MDGPIAGYIFFAIMAAVIFGIASLGFLKVRIRTVDDLVTGGRRAGVGIIAASVMASWVWTTTIMASSEAGMLFGITGGLHYAWGAVVPFFVFVLLALRLRRMMPAASTFGEFIRERFGPTTHVVFLLFGTGVAFYVYTEQLIGAGILMQTVFQVPYTVGVGLTAALVVAYISMGGIRGSLMTDVLQFFVIAIASIIILPWLLSAVGGADFLYSGMKDVVSNPANPNHNPSALSWLSTAGFRYGLAAVIIAMGQVLLEQGYYQRAFAAVNLRQLNWGYVLGGVVAWFAIPLSYGTLVGASGLALGLGNGEGIASTSEVAPYVFNTVVGPIAGVLFATLTFMAATSTADTSLAGIQSLLVVDFYEKYWKKGKSSNTDRQQSQLRFGRVATVAFGIVGAAVALAAGADVSLLFYDIFSGILFASPVAAFVLGIFWRRVSSTATLLSIVAGLGGGLAAWFLIQDDEINWFAGNVISFVVPFIVVTVLTPFTSDNFDFRKLLDWRPAHWTSVRK